MRFKRFVVISSVIISSISFSGCEATNIKCMQTGGIALEQLNNRVEQNRKIAEQLNTQGYISNEVYNEIDENITKTTKALSGLSSDLNNAVVNLNAADWVQASLSDKQLYTKTMNEEKNTFKKYLCAADTNLFASIVAIKFIHESSNKGDLFARPNIEKEINESSESGKYLSNFIGRWGTAWCTSVGEYGGGHFSGDGDCDKGYDIYRENDEGLGIVNHWLFADQLVSNKESYKDTSNGYKGSDSLIGFSPTSSQTIFGESYICDDGKIHQIRKDVSRISVGKNYDTYRPLTITPESAKNELQELLDLPIYVLNPNITSKGNLDENKTLDSLYLAIKDIITLEDKVARDEKLCGEGANSGDIKYFVNSEVKFKDLYGKDIFKNIIGKSKWPTQSFDPTKAEGQNVPGYDLVVFSGDKITEDNPYDSKKHIPCILFRTIEFNKEYINIIQSLTGIFNFDAESGYGKYLVSLNGKSNRIYLLEYPVYAIDNVKNKDNNAVSINLKQTGIGINIVSGKTIRYKYSDTEATFLQNGAYIKDSGEDSKDMFYTSALYNSNGKQANSSFCLLGKVKFKISVKAENNPNYNKLSSYDKGIADQLNEKEVYTARLVLRDYAEITYAPKYFEGSNAVVFGRKIRIQNIGKHYSNNRLTYNKNETFGIYVDHNGVQSASKRKIKVTDLCSIDGIQDTDCSFNYIERLSKPGEKSCTKKAVSGDSDIVKVANLKQKIIGDKGKGISPCIAFPSFEIGEKDDYNESNNVNNTRILRMHGLAVRTGIFDSGLFDYWIESTDTDASLIWWNKYLESNGFKYRVDHAKLNNYLKIHYSSEVGERGIILLDLETISEIQKIYDKEEDEHRIALVRTTFMILGWFLIAFSSILMILWAIDANLDLGLGLLEKATFGHWIAVKYESDIPFNNKDDKCYVTAVDMLFNCFILIAIGIVIIRLNIFSLVATLINLFGGIASKIEELIKGIRY